jgi:XTP/dITP diphosphohydrolase
MATPRLVVATRNDHKLRELAEILDEAELVALPEDVVLPPETGATFAENALIKARTTHEATGERTIADDSGITVAALGGRPGVHSARFAGPDATDQQNLDLLISQVARHDDRSAAYVCVIAHIGADGAEQLFEGRCEGTLITEPRGTGGFGYDPAFVPLDTGPGDGRTMAELGAGEKHAISHRGRAARALAAALWPGRG